MKVEGSRIKSTQSPILNARSSAQGSDKFSDGLPTSSSSLALERPLRRGSASTRAPNDNLSPTNKALREGKGWLEPTSSDEHLGETTKSSLPPEETSGSPSGSNSDISNYQTASNTPIITADDSTTAWSKGPVVEPVHSVVNNPPNSCDTELSTSDREHAQKIYDDQDDAENSELAAAWLGNPDRGLIRRAYMELFDWANMNILTSMRSLCSHLILKGETQQVDRILDAFSTRWCECNPNHGFKATGELPQDSEWSIEQAMLTLTQTLFIQSATPFFC
jgi:hypothetical protein